jgi:hypothetical protein
MQKKKKASSVWNPIKKRAKISDNGFSEDFVVNKWHFLSDELGIC